LRALKLKPDVIHAHDHAAALIPAYLKTLYCEDSHVREVASVLTIHDLRFQGVHEREFLDLTGLPSDVFHSASPFEFWGKVNVMKAGVCFADLVSTLSPRHAQEITWSEEAGIGLEGVLRERQQDLVGIVSGIDVDTWDPRSDPALTARFSCDALGGKKLCRQDLVQRFGFDDRLAVVALVTPLVEEKGIELLETAADELLERDVSVVILGTGEGRFESFVRAWRDRRQGRVAAVLGDNEELARQIIAGADLFLMPSRLERCGSAQLHAMRYGTIPVVRAVGGLADTVRDFEPPGGKGNGFTFAGYTAPDLLEALDRALAAWQNPEQRALLIRRGMTRDDSWDRAAAAYVDAFERARERKHRDNPRSWATGAVEQR
jgi:starch synthase